MGAVCSDQQEFMNRSPADHSSPDDTLVTSVLTRGPPIIRITDNRGRYFPFLPISVTVKVTDNVHCANLHSAKHKITGEALAPEFI